MRIDVNSGEVADLAFATESPRSMAAGMPRSIRASLKALRECSRSLLTELTAVIQMLEDAGEDRPVP